VFNRSFLRQLWCLALLACGTGDRDTMRATADSSLAAATDSLLVARKHAPGMASESLPVRDTTVSESAMVARRARIADSIAADTFPKATVIVCVEHRDSATVYSYQVHNGSTTAARLWQLGWVGENSSDTTDAPLGGGELFTYPRGADTTSVSGEEDLGAASVRTPPHWTAKLQHVEDSNGAVIFWARDAMDSLTGPQSQFSIHPGETKSGFTVFVPYPDDAYERGHFTLIPDTVIDFVGRVRRARAGEMPCPTAR
jgi:hypothetical protein